MEQEAFIEQFEELRDQYEQNQRNIVAAMQDLVLNYNGNDPIYHLQQHDGTNSDITIEGACIDELLKVYQDVRTHYELENNAERQNVFRNKQVEQNKFTQDNPYPNFK